MYAPNVTIVDEPVSLEDTKIFLRTILGDVSEDEAVIMPVIVAAREYCENVTGRAIAKQTVEYTIDSFSHLISIPRIPLISVDEISYKDENGVEYTIDNFDVDKDKGILFIPEIPDVKLYPFNPITIKYTSGYDPLPKTLRQAILLMAAHWYENREMLQFGSRYNEVQAGLVPQLLNQYKLWWF